MQTFHQLYPHHPYERRSPVMSGKIGHPYVSYNFLEVHPLLLKLYKENTS